MDQKNPSPIQPQHVPFILFGLAAVCLILVVAGVVPFRVPETRYVEGSQSFGFGGPVPVQEPSVNGAAIVLLIVGGLLALAGLVLLSRRAPSSFQSGQGTTPS